MKNVFKLIGIIALVAVIGFSMITCGDEDDPPPGGGDPGGSNPGSGDPGGGDPGGGNPGGNPVDSNPIAVSWTNLTANGTTNTIDTTSLTLTFDKDPVGLAIGNVTVTGATKGTLTASGATRTLSISNITVAQGANVTVTFTNPTGYTITPNSKTVAIKKGPVFTAVADNTFLDYVAPGSSSTYKASIFDIAYGNGKFVAVGGYSGIVSKIATSTDGITWTAVADNTFGTSAIQNIAYVDGKFFASGGSKTAYSTDGETWTALADIAFGSIAYGNGKFVSGGGSGKMWTSTDGITWTEVANSPFSISSNIVDIVYGNGTFVAGAFLQSSPIHTAMATSTDGTNWTIVSNGFGYYNQIEAIVYVDGKFFAVGSFNSNGKIATSSDGITWTTVNLSTLFSDNIIYDIAYGNGSFVAVGSFGKMATSTNGTTWTAVADNSIWEFFLYGNIILRLINAIAYGNGTFVAGSANGADGQMAYWKP